MTKDGYTESFKSLEKGIDAVESAEYDLKGGFLLASVNRAYYACFYSMMALLYTQNIYTKTHQGAHVKFFETFIKTGIFSIETADRLTKMFKYRQEADYDLDATVSPEEAEELIRDAREFLQQAKAYLQILAAEPKK